MGDDAEQMDDDSPKEPEPSLSPNKDGGGSVPSGFVLKLYQMVNGAPDEVISWLPSGDAFKISDLRRLESETLPAFFRHRRFQSLVRQLNFYNFRKVNRERTFWVYRHPLFHRDRPSELHLLRRRTCPGVDGRKNRPGEPAEAGGGATSPRSSTAESSLAQDDGSDYDGGDGAGAFGPPKKRKKGSGRDGGSRKQKQKRASLLSVSSDWPSGGVGPEDAAAVESPKVFMDLSQGAEEETAPASIASYAAMKHSGDEAAGDEQVAELLMGASKGREVSPDRSDRRALGAGEGEGFESYPFDGSDAAPAEVAAPTSSTQREHPLLSTASAYNSDIDEVGAGSGNGESKISRTERAERSALVSQVARQLEAHVRRATWKGSASRRAGGSSSASSRGSGGGGAAGGGGGTVTPPVFLTDTMKYNALTYDDEIIVGEESDDYAELEKLAREGDEADDVLVVTDGDDSGEEDSRGGSKKKKKKKRAKKGAAAAAAASIDKARDAKREDATPAEEVIYEEERPDISHLQRPPVSDPLVVSIVGRKLLDRLPRRDDYGRGLAHPSSSSSSCKDDGHVAAAVAGFCMTTAPLDADLPGKALRVLSSCAPLAAEFLRYRYALDPNNRLGQQRDSSSSASSSSSRKPPPPIESFHQQTAALRKFLTGGDSRREETVRDFKVFVVNRLDELAGDIGVTHRVGLRGEELSALRRSVAAWSSSVSIQ